MGQERNVELHSEACRCHGYLWQVWVPGTKRTPCCKPGEDLPHGAVLLPVSRWVKLGTPKTVEQYQEAELRNGRAAENAVA
jgi:hypothetical protein